ncbi:MAG TPA: acyltransferase domain-containing protein [Geobacteraceae bacterium]
MFPGQPLSHDATLPEDADFTEIALLTRARTGLDLESFAWTGGPGTEQVKLQVYGVAMSLYETRCLRRRGILPDVVAEHSMGIYPALSACGALPEGEALELTFRAGCCMATMGRTQSYALGCMVGLTMEPLLTIAEETGTFLANVNTSRHFLLCGERHRMEQAVAAALQNGAFSARTFPCDAPLHTPLMEQIEGELQEIFSAYSYQEPAVPLISHIDQEYLTAADLPGFMLRELTQPVYWEKTYLALRRAGATSLYEAGIGDSLKKYNRWIESERGR